jgi:hypothetical protein
MIYEVALQKAQEKASKSEELVGIPSSGFSNIEIDVTTSEIAMALPDISMSQTFVDLMDSTTTSQAAVTNGTSKLKKLSRRGGYSSDEDLPEIKMNGIHRNEDGLKKRMAIVTEHLTSLADDSTLFIRSASASLDDKPKDDETWTINFLSLHQFIRRNEVEKIIERKYGLDALRLIKLIEEKTHIDQDQVFPMDQI